MTKRQIMGIGKSPLLGAAVLTCGLLLAGCDENVRITRDQNIPVLKHQTWAWRPAADRRETRNDRPVISRDVIGRRKTVAAESDPANDATRQELRTAIERHLTAKGLTQVNDPEAADFLVDYQFAMRRRNVTVERVYLGAYPRLVCGPFGCWEGWGYGPPEVGFENIRFREGTLVFDFVKREPNRLAYQAIGQEPAHHATFTHDQVNDMVHACSKGSSPRDKWKKVDEGPLQKSQRAICI